MVYYGTASSAQNNLSNATRSFEQQTIFQKNSCRPITKLANQLKDNLQLQCYACLYHLLNPSNQSAPFLKYFLNQAREAYFEKNTEFQLMFHGLSAWAKHDIDESILIFSAAAQIYPHQPLYSFIANHLATLSGQTSHLNRVYTMNKKLHKVSSFQPYNNLLQAQTLIENQSYLKAEIMLKKNHHNNPTCNPTLLKLSISLYLQQKFQQCMKALECHSLVWRESNLDLQLQRLLMFVNLNSIQQHTHQAYAHYQQALKIAQPKITHDVCLITLLWRMQLSGIDIECPMQELVQSFGNRPFEFYNPLSSAHYAYAYATVNKTYEAYEIIDIHHYTLQQMHGKTAQQWQLYFKPFIRGIVSFANLNYKRALNELQPFKNNEIWLNSQCIQSEIIHATWIYCLFHQQPTQTAHQNLKQYLPHFCNTPLQQLWEKQVE